MTTTTTTIHPLLFEILFEFNFFFIVVVVFVRINTYGMGKRNGRINLCVCVCVFIIMLVWVPLWLTDPLTYRIQQSRSQHGMRLSKHEIPTAEVFSLQHTYIQTLLSAYKAKQRQQLFNIYSPEYHYVCILYFNGM